MGKRGDRRRAHRLPQWSSPSHSPSLPWVMAQLQRPPPGGFFFSFLNGVEEGLLAARIVAAAPERPAVRGALARDHLHRARRAGGGLEVALRRHLEKVERFFRLERADLAEELGAVDEADLLLGGEVARFLGELARGHQHAFADVCGGHHAAQLAYLLDPDPVGVPWLALHDDGGDLGALLVQVDIDAAVGAAAGELGPEAQGLAIGGAELLEAPPVEPLQQLRGPLAEVELRARGLA